MSFPWLKTLQQLVKTQSLKCLKLLVPGPFPCLPSGHIFYGPLSLALCSWTYELSGVPIYIMLYLPSVFLLSCCFLCLECPLHCYSYFKIKQNHKAMKLSLNVCCWVIKFTLNIFIFVLSQYLTFIWGHCQNAFFQVHGILDEWMNDY